MTARRYESLDGLRGICALMVTVFHCDAVVHNGHLLNHAYICVDAFFVISGFVIACAYERRLANGLSIRQFLGARGRRLLPTQILGTIVVSIVAAAGLAITAPPATHFPLGHVLLVAVMGVFLIPDFTKPFVFPFNIPLWTLADEWFVNVVYAGWMRRYSNFTLGLIVTVSWALLLSYCVYFGSSLNIGMHPIDFGLGVVRAAMGFAAGVIVFRLLLAGNLERLPRLTPGLVYAICFLWAAGIPVIGSSPLYDLFAVATFPFLVALLVRTDRRPARVFVWLGNISYPLYVSQFAAMWTFDFAWGMGSRGTHHSALYAVPIIALALLVACLIERALRLQPLARIAIGRSGVIENQQTLSGGQTQIGS